MKKKEELWKMGLDKRVDKGHLGFEEGAALFSHTEKKYLLRRGGGGACFLF